MSRERVRERITNIINADYGSYPEDEADSILSLSVGSHEQTIGQLVAMAEKGELVILCENQTTTMNPFLYTTDKIGPDFDNPKVKGYAKAQLDMLKAGWRKIELPTDSP